jgi:hypothetical protein|eukprot:31475-Pelagococcus_subviridis.AAC.9
MIHRWEGCERVSVRSRRKRAVSARGGGEGGTSRPTGGGGGANNRENIPSAANAAQGVGKIAREMRAASPLRARATAVSVERMRVERVQRRIRSKRAGKSTRTSL